MANRRERPSERIALLAVTSLAGCSLDLPDRSVYAGGTALRDAAPEGSPATGSVPADAGADAGTDAAVSPSSDAGASPRVACGGNGIAGDKSTLYRSDVSGTTVVEVCPRGCEWTTNAAKDRCRDQANCDYGIGLYCGDNGLSGAPDVLFRCGGGRIVPEERCVNGCERRPANTDDRCR